MIRIEIVIREVSVFIVDGKNLFFFFFGFGKSDILDFSYFVR